MPVLERLRQALEQYGQLQSHLKEAQRLKYPLAAGAAVTGKQTFLTGIQAQRC